MPTVLDHITGALRLIGVVAEGELPSSEAADSAFVAFNQWIDSLSLGVAVHSTQEQSIPWPSGDNSLTFGASGTADVAGIRPVSVLPSTYYNDGSLDEGLYLIGEDEYRALALKELSAPPTSLFVNYTTPDVTLYLYPVPNEAITLHLVSVVELAQAATLADDIIVPAGYLRAFRFGLAVELAAEFGVEPTPTVQKIAWQSMRILKRQNMKNSKKNKLTIPCELSGKITGSIYEG